jgi:hypothetical protein
MSNPATQALSTLPAPKDESLPLANRHEKAAKQSVLLTQYVTHQCTSTAQTTVCSNLFDFNYLLVPPA